MAGMEVAWAEKYIAAQGVGESIVKSGVQENATTNVKITYGSGTWKKYENTYGDYTNELHIDGGTSGVEFTEETTVGTLSQLPSSGSYVVFEPQVDGVLWLDFKNNNATTNYCWVQVNSDGITKETFTYIPHGGADVNQTNKYFVTAGKKYYFFASNSTIKLYGFTFQSGKVWDFTTESTDLSYKNAYTSKYNGYQCKLLDGCYDGLALQQNDTWTVTAGTGINNNGSGQRGIVVVNLEEGDHIKVEYTLNGYSGFTTYGNRSEEEKGETEEAGHKYRVYRMTANGDFALWIARRSQIRKITVIKFRNTESSKEMTKAGTYTPTLFNPDGLTVASYSSSNTDVATVNGSGMITAVAGGTATIAATTTEGYQAKIVVTIPLDFVWSSTAKVTLSLLDADNNNHVDAYLPTLLNPNGSTVTYSPNSSSDNAAWFANKAWEDPWGLSLYGKPRIRNTGTVTLTAHSSDPTEPDTSFELEITDPGMTTGTNQSAYQTYEFNSTGRLSAGATISDVGGITMQYGVSSDLPVVVNSGGMTVVKMIDGNGFSHPNLTNGDASHENKIPIGGTFYKFTTTAAGKLIVFGVFDNPKMYDSERNEITLSGAGNTRTATLESSKTYYLYNNGSNQPMLHSYRYVPLASSLTFRNPEPIITVDLAEGKYTNPAVSTVGMPITYSKLSGNATVNAETGLVTYTGGVNTPGTVVIQASDGTEIISYILQFVKRTWIFNENDKWTTTSSSLTSGGGWDTNSHNDTGNGLDGSTFYRNTASMNHTQLTTDGTNVMPETAGLYISKESNNDRFYIAPRNLTPNYIAMRASSIYIDDVQTGQTVTVNWKGGNSSAVLDMADAADANATGKSGGTLQLTATQTGQVRISSNPIVSYIRSISVSTPTRAIGTLTYAKSVIVKDGSNPGEVLSLSGYTLTDEAGLNDFKAFYNTPTNYQTSNSAVATVDPDGRITATGEGTAIITATATAKNSNTHQASVTLVATIEVVGSAATRIRTIHVSDLLYTTGSTTASDYDRIIPGFTFSYTGADNTVTCTTNNAITLSNGGKLVIAPRPNNETITIEKALVTVKTATDSPTWNVNGSAGPAISADGIVLPSLTANSLTLELTAGSVEITDIKLYYHCLDAANADNCLVETKVGPVFKFEKEHLMRIPNDGKAFTQTPTQVMTENFKSFQLSYTYASSATNIATINTDGTNGQLLKAGESTITATFHETTYFAGATASYTVDNILLGGEKYDDVAINNNQRIHIEASAYADNTDLTITGATGTTPHSGTLRYGTARSRNNTYATVSSNPGSLSLANNTSTPIVIYSLRVVTSVIRAWLYYQGQEDNYFEQVLFTGFKSGNVAGFRVVDVGAPDNPIDLTDAYDLSGAYSVEDVNVLTGLNNATGEVTAAATAGSSTISHAVSKKTGMADGYDDNINISTTVQVLTFDDSNPVTWDFMSVANGNDVLYRGWTYDDRGFQYGYFSEYTPIFIFKNGNADVIGYPNEQGVTTHMHGILLKDEFRWYHTRGLRANLSQPKASFKFPVKAGMEIDIYAASSSADVSNTISNVTDINGNETDVFYIAQDGEDNPVHNYFIAKEDGMVEVKATDKVGVYLHSITLSVPKIHFTDDVVTTLQSGDDGERHIINATTNIEENSLKNLSYSITTAKNFGGDDISSSELGSIAAKGDENAGRITLTGGDDGYGWFEVTVTNDSPASALEPRTGTYKVYVVDFKFDPETDNLNLDYHNGEDYYGDNVLLHYPVGRENVLTPINYTFEIAGGNSARAMLRQDTKSDPSQTTYQLTAYSPGEIILKATTGRITATRNLTVGGNAFQYVAPVLSDKDIAAAGGDVFTNTLPVGFNATNTATVGNIKIAVAGTITTPPSATVVDNGNGGYDLRLTGLKSLGGYGAIRCTVTAEHIQTAGAETPEDDTDDEYADKTVQFVLTIAYPPSSNKKWDFYRIKNGQGGSEGLKAESDHDNKVGDYASSTVPSYIITGTKSWTTETSWSRIHRNASKEPRWALDRSMHSDNAFVIEETAGLMIETPTKSFYVDNNDGAAYTHIGVHSRSTITIPKLKNGDFVSLNLSRVIPNNGAIIEAQNVTDLAGKVVNTAFTITRSQTDYHENGELARDGDGTRIIPGYYTFIAHKDGADENDEFDVSFTLADEGYLDVLAIEIYSPKSRNSGYGYDKENGYDYTMRGVKLDATGYPDAPITLLKEEGQQRVYDLTYCHQLWSTSVGPAEYVERGKSDNLHADFENVGWYSAGGAFYNNGRITVNDGYGRIKVRMENYTAEGKYLIGYTPDYSLTVGHPPHQDYPFTWNFENISGGAVKSKNNNAYNSINSDYYTWKNLGYESYQLDTRTSGGSLYVPGATLVTEDRDLGQKGEISYLNSHNLGCDEFNGLGFDGQFSFRLALQGDAEPAAPAASDGDGSLLEYKMTKEFGAYTVGKNKANTADSLIFTAADSPAEAETKTYWKAGDGLIMFGSAGKRQASALYPSYDKIVYLMDGGNTKYLLIKPERAFREGDVITLKGYTPNNVVVQRSGFSFYAAQMDNSYDDLLTLNWSSSHNDSEQTITHTVQQGDGLAGRDSVYIFRAGKQYSVYLTEISVTTTDETAATIPERALTCNDDVTVTIPDLEVNHYVYIKSSAAPATVPSILTPAVAADGLDAIEGEVYKYKVIAAGDANVTFAADTKIYRIGVTNIMKPMKRVGTGDAWATESRDHAIDYKQTGAFTVNDITANTVTASSYTNSKVTVRLNEKTDAMPAESGMVLKMKVKYTTSDIKSISEGEPPVITYYTESEAETATSTAVANFAKAKGGNQVPLFYPPHSTPILSDAVKFGGTEGNLMMANLDGRVLTKERETGTIDNDGDNVDDSGADDGTYTRFIFADRYMKWSKINDAVTHSNVFDDSGEKPVFYRLHIYSSSEASAMVPATTETELNTLGANKAYMLIRSGNVPDAIWKQSGSGGAKRYIGIEGISDIYEFTDDSVDTEHSRLSGTYNMQGQKMDDNAPLPAGIYIINGRKVAVK